MTWLVVIVRTIGVCAVDLYRDERSHQGLGNELIAPKTRHGDRAQSGGYCQFETCTARLTSCNPFVLVLTAIGSLRKSSSMPSGFIIASAKVSVTSKICWQSDASLLPTKRFGVGVRSLVLTMPGNCSNCRVASVILGIS